MFGTALRSAAILLALVLPGSVVNADGSTFAGPAQGTTYRVQLAAPLPDLALAELRSAVEAVLADIDRHMSTYRDDSDLSRFNRSSSTDWFPVPRDLAIVVRAAGDVHDASGGAFDVTVAPLVELWGFGRKGLGRVPAADEIARVRKAVGSGLIDVRLDPPALRKRHADVRLDLNGIAPGYSVDRIAECLSRRHVDNFLVELGGEIRTSGRPAKGRAWRVGIERPTKFPTGIHLAIELTDAALSTSGDYRHAFEEAGKRYSHILDPRTARPVDHCLTSVSVVADTCMLADAWATALLVLGPEAGPRLAEDQGLAVYFIIREGPAPAPRLRSIATTRFAQRFLEGKRPAIPAFTGPTPEHSPPEEVLDDSPLLIGWVIAIVCAGALVAILLWACARSPAAQRRREKV